MIAWYVTKRLLDIKKPKHLYLNTKQITIPKYKIKNGLNSL
jgi:hypothetical protein